MILSPFLFTTRFSVSKVLISCMMLIVGGALSSTYARELNSGNIVSNGCGLSDTNCDLSNKGITSIALDTFVGYSNLQILILDGNQLTSITSGTFEGLSSLYSLGLSSNQITSIETGGFNGLNNLQQLHLNGNQFTSIENGYFEGLSNLPWLSLSSNQITSIESGDFELLSNLRQLYLESNQITSIESGYFNGLSNLEELYIKYNQITLIGTSGFEGLSNLKRLDLDNNQITSIENGDFNELSSLFSLNLNGNQITSIENGDFNGLMNLTGLILRGNQINSIESDAFVSLTSLQTLDLYGNQITSIESGDFNGLTNLKLLTLWYNQITSIENGDFNGLMNLEELDLDNNQITSIESDDFDGLNNLQTLWIDSNQITSIESGDFSSLTNLKLFGIHSNQFTSIESGDFDGLSNLQNLWIGGNPFTSIESGDFDGLDNLNALDIAGGQITSIESGDFDGLSNLRFLTLNGNKIFSIENDDFVELINLQDIGLEGNQLTVIESDDFDGIRGSCVRVIRLGYNEITSIESGSFDNFNCLHVLKLDSNRITSIESSVFDALANFIDVSITLNCINTEDTTTTNYLDGLGIASLNYSNQRVCPNIEYTPSTSTTGLVTGSIVFKGPTSKVAILQSENTDMTIYNHVSNINETYVIDYSSMIDTNGYLLTSLLSKPKTLNANVTWILESDTTAPATPTITVPMSGTTITGDISSGNIIIVSGTAEIDSLISLTISGMMYTGIADMSGIYTISINLPVGIGTHIITITAIDAAGNTSTANTTLLTIVPLPIIVPPVVVSSPSGGGGGGGSQSIKDYCPNGDYTASYYDGNCGKKPILQIENTIDQIKDTSPQKDKNTLIEDIIFTIPTLSSLQLSRGVIEGEPVSFPTEEIFNEDISQDYCYTRPSDLIIKDTTKITTSEEFKKALTFLYAYDITTFNDIYIFKPNEKLTREQAAKIFSLFAGKVLCRKTNNSLIPSYTDIGNANETLKPYIIEAYQLGLMKGGIDNKFRPKDIITKAEFNAILVRVILKSYLPEDTSDNRYAEYNKVSERLGIITQGAGNTSVFRKNVALMLFRAYKEQQYSLQDIGGYISFVLENRDQFVE